MKSLDPRTPDTNKSSFQTCLFFLAIAGVLVFFIYNPSASKMVSNAISSSFHLSTLSSTISSDASTSGEVVSQPRLSVAQINSVLCAAGSQACGTGQALYDDSVKYNIDDAYAMGVFNAESSYGTLGWGRTNHALGNIRCTAGYICNGGYRYYPTWQSGYDDWFLLIKNNYVAEGLTNVNTIAQKYAPSSENNTSLYVNNIRHTMAALTGGK